jgi:iron complex outermembrane receptor protein
VTGRTSRRRRVTRAGCIFLLCATLPQHFGAAHAQKVVATLPIQVPAGPAGNSLRMLAETTGAQIAFREEDVAGELTRSVRGRITAQEALRRMLQGTGLRMSRGRSGVFVIRPEPKRVASRPVSTRQPSPVEGGSATAVVHQTPIFVTGSRIRPTAKEPVGAVFSVEMDSVQLGHALRAEDLIATLPVAGTEQGAFLSGQATGTATVNLRGLGSARTLVLVNGRRMMPGDPLAMASDLNMVPLKIMKRVEVLSGGGSSIYGSDAVAGVINFITDDEFEGFDLSSSVGAYVHDNQSWTSAIVRSAGYLPPSGMVADGWTKEVTLRVGASLGGRGHIVAYGTMRQTDGIYQSGRDYSSCALSRVAPASDTVTCLGSNTTAPGRFILNGGGGAAVTLDPSSDGFRPYSAHRDSYNYAPDNNIQRPDRRSSAGVAAHYEISPSLAPFAEIMLTGDRTEAQIAPSGIFGQVFPIACDNPLLSAAQAAAICGEYGGTSERRLVSIGRRNVEGRPRVDYIRHQAIRATIGLRGAVAADWRYEGHVQYGRSTLEERFTGDLSRTRIARALEAVTDTRPGSPTFGSAVCASVINGEDPACQPYDVWGKGPIAAAAVNYLNATASMRGHTEQWIAQATLTGRLDRLGLRSPWADEAVGVVVGAEFRRDALKLDFDPVFESGDLAGQSGTRRLDQSGRFNVVEAFGELQLPLAGKSSAAGRLTLEFGLRASHYSTAGGSFSGRAGLSWAVAQGVTVRGSYNRAVRAPNVSELFAPTRNPTFSGWDPCAGSVVSGLVNGYSFADCAASGVTQEQFGNIAANPARLFNIRTGGNPFLRPELADTVTIGLTVTPLQIQRLSISFDYFDISVQDAISQVGANLILTRCVQTREPVFCSLVHRSPINGSLDLGNEGYVEDPLRNIGSLATSGLDLGVKYAVPLPPKLGGEMRMSLTASHVFTQISERAPEVGRYDCAGLYGLTCGLPTPRWRHRITIGWGGEREQSALLTWRRLGSVVVDRTSSDPLLTGAIPADRGRIPSQDYLDLSIQAPVTTKLTATLGILNLLDRDPPVVASDSLIGVLGNGNTFPQVYDPLGRFVQLSVSLRL